MIICHHQHAGKYKQAKSEIVGIKGAGTKKEKKGLTDEDTTLSQRKKENYQKKERKVFTKQGVL